jgi:aminopeptidase N
LFEKKDLFENIENPKIFVFDESKKISTYLFAIVAGPYAFIESKKKDFVPMKVFFR